MIVNAAANRDPSVFDDPDRFNILRPNARQHIGFGFGIHRCLGAELAKSQLSIALDRVLRDLTGLRPAGEAVHHRFNRWRGLASLPVAWEPAT
jgi:cytochrome P450